MESEHDDRYCYSDSRTLINKWGIEDIDKFLKKERKTTTEREGIMWNNPIEGNFDLAHFQAIHKFMFDPIYDWAGELRECNIYKGGSKFCASVLLEETAPSVFDPIKKHGFFIGDNKEELFQHFAETMGRINMLHPFREGNGRAERMFMVELGRCCGILLDFDRIKKDKIIEASLEAEYKKYSGFINILKKISKPMTKQAQMEALANISLQASYVFVDLDKKDLVPNRIDEFKSPVHNRLNDFIFKARYSSNQKENKKDILIR